MRTPRRRTSCRSTASTTSSSGSATHARHRPTTAPCGASRRSPFPVSRRRSVTARLTPEGEIAEHVHRHGDGVHDIAFAVDDVKSAWHETTTRGARSHLEYAEAGSDEEGLLRRSAVHTYGEVIHSFIDRSDYQGAFAPGYRRIKNPPAAAQGLSLLEIDHC